ncbi:hypothetical protein M0R45_009282 [Rubus argutus]|uniref:PCFS4-like zinc finger domain-containing protein n=1 Tax=Rubus argutus TaxID=59490 RepID=A0AAW1Y337_RUBAR
MLQVYGNQRGPYGSMGPVNYQGPSNPWYMPQAVTHRNQVPLGPFQPRFLPPRPNFLPSAQTLVPPYSVVPANSVPHGLPPQGVSPVNNSGPVISSNLSAYSGLLNSLMAQGVISLKNQSTVLQEKDCVGLPRRAQQPSGLACKKNRMSKNRKQKPCRNFYVTTSMWLSTGAEVSSGFSPAAGSAAVAEKKRKSFDEEMVVPADEDQSKCALCREAFVEFYSHEKEEWMYQGAVYLNATQGSARDMDRSQLGPIVHAKCSSEGNQRKRLRMS